MFTLCSFNLNGVRSAAQKGFFEWLGQQQIDVLCVQELKAQAGDMSPDMLAPRGFHGHFHYAEKKGYSGVGIYSRQKPDRLVTGLGIRDIDAEGRYLQADFGDLSVVSLYVPSGSSGPERQAVKFSFMERFFTHLLTLKAQGRHVVICADWNIAHKEMDLKNWRSNQKNSGFLPEERAWMSKVVDEAGWVDVYRKLHPDATGDAYTWWSNRGQAWAKNVGWRLDYQLATPEFASKARSASVYRDSRFSDHAPVSIVYDSVP